MRTLTTAEIRQAFLEYYASKDHTIVSSASLVPAGDPTLLFTNAGMVPFKDCFLGTDKRAYVRATSCQKCLRISGKHNDLENVGRTARHHTFFEMLGNFSFGDYFKQDAIEYAWEFITEVLALPKDRLWVTIFKDDDDAGALWQKLTDVQPDRILRCGEKDNFWAMGDTGPCGPCSEIFYYLGDDVANQSEEEFRKDDGTYIEVWNLVFMQFNRSPSGELEPLPKPSVDTGMGLERISAVKQGKTANYDSDLLRSLITFTEKLSAKKYLGEDYRERDANSDPQYTADVAFRVIADHARASAFLIADGVSPSSDGRGYVLRRLIRRACRHARVLGFTSAFLYDVAGEVVKQMGDAYPELKENAKLIENLLRGEEEKFLTTLDTGIALLEKEVASVQSEKGRVLSGEVAFQLHDTYGFPLDMTQDIVRGLGLSVDNEGFEREMEAQRERSRSARAKETELILQRSVKPTPCEFLGYEHVEYESSIAGIFDKDGDKKSAKEGDEVAIVVPQTPFYAESGGQVGDTGSITSANAALEVIDTQKVGADTIAHICRVNDGSLTAGDKVRLEVDTTRRAKLRVNHTATHLLHYALREVLGEHVKQAGSRVSDGSLRFDFSHHQAISSAELSEIEAIVNAGIQSNYPVETEIMSQDEALKSGATALFGEKYGQSVRVVRVGPNSLELCGGTHANRAGDIGVFSVFHEGSISAGVRRVEAYAGIGATQQIVLNKELIKSLSSALNVGERDLFDRVTRLAEANKKLEGQLNHLGNQMNQARGGDLTEQATARADGTKIVASVIEDASPKQLREMADDLKQRLGSGCIALGSVSEGKVILLAAVTDDLTGRYHAGNLMSEMAKVVGGRGGGRPDMAQAGGGDPTKLDQALEKFQELVA